MSMLAAENGEPMAEALVEQPGGGAADDVTETEEQRLQEVERQRVEKEKQGIKPGKGRMKSWRSPLG